MDQSKIGRMVFTSAFPLALLLTPQVALAETVRLAATLSGAGEVAGDPDGAGVFTVEADPALGDFCYTLSLSKLGKVTGAQVQSNSDATTLIKLDITGASSDECVAVEPKVLEPIVASPAGYVISVRTADYPNGALRGVLGKK